MTPIACPNDDTPLDKDWAREVYVCPSCGIAYVVSISSAYDPDAKWNRHAPGAGAVQAVLDAEKPSCGRAAKSHPVDTLNARNQRKVDA